MEQIVRVAYMIAFFSPDFGSFNSFWC